MNSYETYLRGGMLRWVWRNLPVKKQQFVPIGKSLFPEGHSNGNSVQEIGLDSASGKIRDM